MMTSVSDHQWFRSALGNFLGVMSLECRIILFSYHHARMVMVNSV